jgi:hypothetical protein
MEPYPLLREPIVIGPVIARNRLMMTTHGPRLPQARYLRYLEDRARNGVGLAGFNLGPLGVMQFPFGPGKALYGNFPVKPSLAGCSGTSAARRPPLPRLGSR